jgi:hypothetical protein
MYVYYVVCVCEGLGQVLLALVMSEGRSESWLMLRAVSESKIVGEVHSRWLLHIRSQSGRGRCFVTFVLNRMGSDYFSLYWIEWSD